MGKLVGLALLLLIVLAIAGFLPEYQTIADRIAFVFLMIGVIWFVVFGVNADPRIKVDDKGLLVEFLWRWVRLEWKDIDDIRSIYGSLGGFKYWMVKSQELPSYHCLYGLLINLEMVPCFLVFPRMNEKDELISMIKLHLRGRNDGFRREQDGGAGI